MLSRESLTAAGVFEPTAVMMLHDKCRRVVKEHGSTALLSNTDNMGLVGILSTQLVHHSFICGGSVMPANSRTTQARLIEKP